MDIRDYQVDERTTSSRSFKKNEETTTLSAAKNCLYYDMNHKKTGIAVIFNHEIYFHQLGLTERKGSGSDCVNLENTLNNMGFETEKYLDLTVKEIGAVLDKLVEKDYSDYDCLFIAILSHGNPGVIYAKDSHYPVETLFQRFKSDKCPTLDGKPKIYAIQACRGNKYDDGISVRTIEVDSDSNDTKYPFPLFAEILNADFLIACSTFPGHYSWRNKQTGSWFIQVLCEELNKHCYEYDLLTILTMVIGKVSFDFESDRPLYPSEHKKKQIPCITTMLTKILKFNPKNVVRA